jgi:hypothetical protein
MLSDSKDVSAYRIAVGAIGFALVVVLAGLCVIVALGEAKEIPKELWTITTALGGGLLGLLAPSPKPSAAATKDPVDGVGKKFGRSWDILLTDIWANRSVVILFIVFGLAAGFGVANDSTQLQALAAASGGALIGLLAPADRGPKAQQVGSAPL